MEEEILELLNNTKIPNSSKRANVSGLRYIGKDKRRYGFPIQSATLGEVRCWKSGFKTISNFTLNNLELYELLIDYGNKICPHKFNSICINKNVVCHKHKDINNKGNSTIVAFGDFTGGRLGMEIEPDKSIFIDIKKNPYTFDGGNVLHFTEPFEGTRFSIIYFA